MKLSHVFSMRNQLARFAAVVLAGAVVSFTSASAGASSAPKVTFVGVQLTLNTGTTFTTPQGVAVDSSGDVFVLDSQTGIVSEIVALNGIIGSSPTIQPLANSFAFNNVFSLAIDSSGNLFVPGGSTPGAEYIYEIPAAHRTVNPTQLTLAGTFDTPEGITVDASGNIFVVEDGSANDVKEIAPPYHTATTAIIGLSSPTGIAVDASDNIFVAVGSGGGVTEFSPSNSYATGTVLLVEFEAVSNMSMDTSGNLYVADEQGGTLSEILASGGYGTEITLSKNFNAPTGVAVATNGNIFVTDVPDGGIVDEFERPGANLGAVNLGQTSSTKTLTFVFNTAGHIGAPVVLTQGAAGLDYVDAGTGTCTIKNGSSNPYNAGATCTVDVSFTPRYPGARNGAVELKDLSGNVLATAYLYGTGIGPQVSFVTTASGYNAPSAVSTLGGGFNYPYGVATDQSGNVFVVDQGNVAIKKISAGCGTSTCVTTLAGTYTDPSYVAIDGAGNLYVTDANQVVEISAASGYTTTTNTLGGGPYQPTGVAVDGSGNVYVNDISMVTGERQVQKIPAGCTSSACVTTLAGGYNSLFGMAVAPSGDVFFAEELAGLVHEIPAGCVSTGCVVTVGSGLSKPAGLAVDGLGNLFVSDYEAGNVYEFTAASGYTVKYQLSPNDAYVGPLGVAVDGLGNVTVVNTQRNTLQKLDFADPPSLSFLAPTTIETIDGTDGPLSVTVENVGNAPLIFTASGLIAANDFPQTAGSGDPPNCADSRTVAAGASCNLSIEFEPLQTGSLGETFGLYDNNLNVASAQLIGVQGISIPAVAPPPAGDATSSTVLAAPSAVAAGQPLTITATVTDTTTPSTTPTGSVTFTDAVGSTITSLNGGTAVSLVSGVATLSNATLIGAGTHTISAQYSGVSSVFSASSGTGTVAVSPSSNVGAAASSFPVTLTITAAGTESSVSVLTLGVPNLDFTEALTGDTCSGVSSIKSTCTVNVTFTPISPGLRSGAVVLKDSSGNVLATSSISAMADAPQVAIYPGTSSVLSTGTSTVAAKYPGQIAIDGSGNIYLANCSNGLVYKIPASGGEPTTIDFSALSGLGPNNCVNGIVLDGAGNMYVSDHSNERIVVVNGATGSSPSAAFALPLSSTSLGSVSLYDPYTLAMDVQGNLYIADSANVRILKVVLTGAGTSSVTGAVSAVTPVSYSYNNGSYDQIYGVAVDGSGNVYIPDYDGGVLVKVAPGGATTTINLTYNSNTFYPTGIGLDSFGNVYLVDGYDNWLAKLTTSGTLQPILAPGLPSGLSEPWNITVDPAGKLYISDFGNNRIAIIDPSTPYVAPFASAAVGSNSTSGPQLLQLTNIGDQDLTFTASGVSYPTDFPVNSSDTNLCQSSLNLTAGNTCDVSINFHPTTTGSLPENVVLTDNNLAGNGVQQSISVSGTGQAVIAQFAFSISSIWTAGVPQAFTLTAIGSDSATMTGYTGTVNLTSTDSRAVFSLSNGGAPITSYTFAGGDAGVKTLYVTFKTETFSTKLPYGQFVTATDASASISAMTGSLTVNSGPAATITPVGSTSSSHTIGVEFPLYAVVNDAYGNPVVGEIVTFSAPVNGPGILMAQATEPVQTLGYAENLVFANTIAGGPYAVTAIAADLPSSPLTFAITNLPARTTTVLAGAPASPINFGTAITLTSTVTPGSGQVEKKSLIAQPQKIVIVSSSAPILGPPTGTVQFWDNIGTAAQAMVGTATLQPGVNSNGTIPASATFTVVAPAGGTHSYTATYLTDGNYSGSTTSIAVPYTVNQGSVAISGPAQPAQFAAGQAGSVTITATGSVLGTGIAVPSGSLSYTIVNGSSVSVASGTVSLSATANGSAASIITPNTLAPGTYSIQIGYVGDGNYAASVSPVTITFIVNQIASSISWPQPSAISYGTSLGAILNATASAGSTALQGAFSYTATPTSGAPSAVNSATVLTAGSYTLTATFAPTNSATYTSATQTVSLTVSKAALAITWTAPASISYGVPLSATQLNASATVPGTFVYSPAIGTVLGAGPQTLSVTFTPTDSVDYSSTTQTVSLTVNKTTLAITWITPASISYGVPLSATQLNATATVPGTFVYSPAVGSVLGAGPQTLSVTFTPTDSVDYSTTTQTTSLTVNKASLTITWAAPNAITYGVPLSAAQLNATASVPGTFVYSPALGSVLGAGSQTLSVTFTPTDSVDYSATTQTTSLTVNKDAASITWSGTSTPITYGTPLSATQLNATTVIPGTLVYAPPLGTVLGAGTQSLSVTFTPTDTASYASVTKTETLTVNKAMPVITWLVPAAITPETALSATQLDATASVPGMFVYTPSLGTMLSIGTQTLSVIFTANDTTDYTTATQSVSLNIGQITPTITFLQPSAITYGNSLSGVLMVTAKNGSATIPGTFTYTAARAGGSALPVTSATVLAAGTYTLTAIFTPTDTTTYKVASASVSLTANQAVSVTTLSSSQVSAFTSNPVTFTAIVTSAAGTPTGSVTFFDGTTPLGTATLVSGSAAYTSSSLDTGTHSITAVYNGNADLAPSTSGLVSEVLQNFTLTLSLRGGSGSGGTATAAPGGQAVYDFVVAPVTGTGFPGPVTMSVTGGLPPGATATFTPDVIPANATSTPVTMTVTLPATAAARPMGLPFRSAPLAALGLLLLPFAGRLRKASRKLGRGAGLALALLISIVGIAAMTGCGGKPSGYFGQAPQSYTITVTATSGNLTHSTTVTLNVQ